VGTIDLRTTRNLDFVMGEVYALVATAKRKLLNCRLVLSGVLQRRDGSWQHTGALNDRFDWRRTGALNDRFNWVANALGLNFVDLNSWIEDGDFTASEWKRK